jgi:hypothetical protein
MARSREELIAVARAHAEAEAAGDLEATLATLDPDPVYELQPVGLTLSGMDAVRRYYAHFFSSFASRSVGGQLRSEWVGDDGLAQEYVVEMSMPDGGVEVHSILGVLVFGRTGLAGERIWASERVLRALFGPLYDEAVPRHPSG